MANKQISELTTGSITSDNDVFIIDTYEGTTVKIPYSVLASMILQTSLGAGAGVTITEDSQSDVFKMIISASGGTGSGTVWYITDTEPANPATDDVWLHTDAANYGDIDVYNGVAWVTQANMKGADGDDGQPGQDGAAATITVGTVTTGEAGTNASVTNSGTTSAAVFNFTIPRGATGETGATGATGAQGYSISATFTNITGGHRVTLHSTDPSVIDTYFDVMDGIEIIQTTSDNRQVTLLAENWEGSSAPYTQTVAFTGMTADTAPILDIAVSDTAEDGLAQLSQWGLITKAVSAENTIIFSCYQRVPTVDLTVNVKVV